MDSSYRVSTPQIFCGTVTPPCGHEANKDSFGGIIALSQKTYCFLYNRLHKTLGVNANDGCRILYKYIYKTCLNKTAYFQCILK